MTALYPLFVAMAAATILSPGPGVLMTLTNALRGGARAAFAGVCGIACGAAVVAAISATSIGVLLATSATAFSVMKLIGAGYLIYLGVRAWRAPPHRFEATVSTPVSARRRFSEGLSLQITNPKAVFFFLSVFPQFIEARAAFLPQFALLVATYGALILIIHGGYALTARRASRWLSSTRGGLWMNRISGAAFVCFGAAMATARR